MNIFLRRIPANTKHVEISDFVRPALHNGLFKKPGQIINIEILTLRDIRQDSIEYHGLVTLDSEWAVNNAIKGLKNRRLNGRYVLVRPYYHRSWNNDPRQQALPVETEKMLEKRHGDRRRGKHLEVIKNVSDRFNSEADFKSFNHQQYQITFIVAAEIEVAIADFFVSFELDQIRRSNDPTDLPDQLITRFLCEQEEPQNKTRRFQIYASRQVISALLEKLKTQFTSNQIHYWVTPVVEFGVI